MKTLRNLVTIALLLVLAFLAVGCSGGGGKTITVFAGSSVKAALEQVAESYHALTGTTVLLNFGGSGSLLAQLQLSRQGDLYLPAAPEFMQKAVDAGVVVPETEVVTNYLVPAILVAEGNPLGIAGLEDLARPGLRVAICDPATVPAGLYAYELLARNGRIEDIAPNIVTYTENNEQLSGLVILGAVDAAIGWDVVARYRPDDLDTVYFPPAQVPRLSYMSAAVTTFSEEPEAARNFLEYIMSREGRLSFDALGYYAFESQARAYAPDAVIGGEYRLPDEYRPLVR